MENKLIFISSANNVTSGFFKKFTENENHSYSYRYKMIFPEDVLGNNNFFCNYYQSLLQDSNETIILNNNNRRDAPLTSYGPINQELLHANKIQQLLHGNKNILGRLLRLGGYTKKYKQKKNKYTKKKNANEKKYKKILLSNEKKKQKKYIYK